MLKLKYLVLSLSLLAILHAVNAEDQKKSKFLSCNAANATAEVTGCPKGANCIENGTVNGTLTAFCVCGPNSTVNENYTAKDTKSQYCIDKEGEKHPTDPPTKATEVPTAAPASPKPTPKPTTKPKPTESPTTEENKEETKNSDSDKSDVKIAPAPESHHLIGGILLPIVMVLAFIGVVFAVKKYDLVDRAHGYVRGRNQATRYNGLMENDFDDDPLLI